MRGIETSPASSPQHAARLRQLSLHQPPAIPPFAMRADHSQSQQDEGFSEYPESTSISDDADMTSEPDFDLAVNYAGANPSKLLSHIIALPLGQRAEIVEALIPTLPNNVKDQIAGLIERLTHFDPTVYLPSEVFLLILSYLTPADLLGASRVSRAWRWRAQDERLWRVCFAREGWLLDRTQVDAFETFAERKGRRAAESILKGTSTVDVDLERRESRKRGREEAFKDEGRALLGQASEQPPDNMNMDCTVDDQATDAVGAGQMEGVETTSGRLPTSVNPPVADVSPSDALPNPADSNFAPTLFQSAIAQPHQLKVSWPYLYKQRRRLEANWDAGNYSMFQLPHKDYPHEGHDECVYTIQHTPRHLVSGSRDRTIRIWDLQTQRLKGKPLCGHEASVLCLQFDERPEHDIIVSGGSDACVIVWKFSTGEIIKRLTQAHDESVLNLRFDDRYIVTCSKDKTIKVWNRRALPSDSPLIPQHVLQNSPLASELAAGNMIMEYTLLTTLLGHAAAVNAVMIHNNTIVSASGDRYIKSWDLNTGQFKKSYSGHAKGIACVQFDGRRIVSGSSDNTVRIFDAEQQAEIACLTGHINLVRTVQARFGDLDIVTDAELAAEARKADMGFYAALARGMQPASVSRRHGGGVRNAGSSRPEAMLAVGAKVPPGGGGSRWAKIVSGSYDENVIVWKKDAEGNWFSRLRLRQDELLRPQSRRRSAVLGAPQPPRSNGSNASSSIVPTGSGTATLAQAQAHHHLATAHGHLAHANNLLHANQQHGQANQQHHQPASHLAAIANNVQSQHQHLTQTAQQQASNLQTVADGAQTTNGISATAALSQQQLTTVQSNDIVNAAANSAAAVASSRLANARLNQQQQQQQQQQAPGAAGPANVGVAAPGAGHHGQPRDGRESNRVFKLQFDARRIICCSQNKVIVGWDFANGDPELEKVGEWSIETA